MGKPDWAMVLRRLDELEKDVGNIKEAISKSPMIFWREGK